MGKGMKVAEALDISDVKEKDVEASNNWKVTNGKNEESFQEEQIDDSHEHQKHMPSL
jgi:hypothetical protein